jgi:hypothetical protein
VVDRSARRSVSTRPTLQTLCIEQVPPFDGRLVDFDETGLWPKSVSRSGSRSSLVIATPVVRHWLSRRLAPAGRPGPRSGQRGGCSQDDQSGDVVTPDQASFKTLVESSVDPMLTSGAPPHRARLCSGFDDRPPGHPVCSETADDDPAHDLVTARSNWFRSRPTSGPGSEASNSATSRKTRS